MPEFVKRFTYVYLVRVWYLRNVTLPRNFCAVNIDEDKESNPENYSDCIPYLLSSTTHFN